MIGVSTVIVGFQLARPYNQSLTPVEAIERLRRLDDEQLTWVEEPTLAHDFLGMAGGPELGTAASAGELGPLLRFRCPIHLALW